MIKDQHDNDIRDDIGNEADKLDEDLSVLREELYANIGLFQEMFGPITHKTTFYSCWKADKPPKDGFYLIDTALELTATGRYSVLTEA